MNFVNLQTNRDISLAPARTRASQFSSVLNKNPLAQTAELACCRETKEYLAESKLFTDRSLDITGGSLKLEKLSPDN